MSSYVLMKILESTPERYDRGIRLLSRGRIDSVYAWIAERVARPGRRILDLGCGTGGVALACAERGARAVGIDVNPAMLEIARAKAERRGLEKAVEWVELGAAEIGDRFADASFGAVVSCLAFSELSPDERAFVLRALLRVLEPGGELVVADEVLPPPGWRRALFRLGRLPWVVLTWLLTQNTTRAVEDLAATVREAGFERVEDVALGSHFRAVVARRPAASGEGERK